MPSRPSQNRTRFEIAARRTHETAIAMVEAETTARQAKVALLRAARLEREALEASKPAPPTKPARKRPAKAGR